LCAAFPQITLERVLPFWHNEIAPDIRAGKRVIIAAHGTTSLVSSRTDVSPHKSP
jgi:bisphosphoglycerate-dependent phosphoglycerate mutase